MNSISKKKHLTKKETWKSELENVRRLTDKLGLHVDRGIEETVAILHIFGIHTSGSHEGKIDRYPIPYVDVLAPETERLYGALMKSKGKDKKSEKERQTIRNRITEKNLEERKKIIPLLEAFYSTRKAKYETRLEICSMALGWSRIQSGGVDFQLIEKDKELKRLRLRRFQKEMRTFTVFLKNKYFSNKRTLSVTG